MHNIDDALQGFSAHCLERLSVLFMLTLLYKAGSTVYVVASLKGWHYSLCCRSLQSWHTVHCLQKLVNQCSTQLSICC